MNTANPDFDEVLGQWLVHLDEVDHTSADALVAQHPEFATELRAHLSAENRLCHRLDALSFDAPVADPAFSELPQDWGEYRLEQMLGNGAMGEIYLALHQKLNRHVALKVMRGDAHLRRSGLARFSAEARVAANLRHPNIARIYDVGEREGRLFYTMDFVDGKTLKQAVVDTAIDARSAAKTMAAIADAVEYAHQQNIVHRDLKPSNVIVDSATNEPIVTDFGLAKNLVDSHDMTRTGDLVGTPAFVAPDQLRNADGFNAKSGDIYGMGATLYQLLTGRPPYEGANSTQVLWQVLETSPKPPNEYDNRLPDDIVTICMKAMSRESADRYASAAAFAEDLRRFLNGEPIQARPISRLTRALRWSRRHPGTAAMMAALAAFFLASPFVALITNQMRIDAVQARREMEVHKTRQEKATEQFLDAFRSPDPRRDGKSITVYETLQRAKDELDENVDDPLLRAQLSQAFGETFLNLDLHDEALELLDDAHDYYAENFGDAPKTWNARRMLGLAEIASGNAKDVIGEMESVCAKFQSELGDDHADTHAAKYALVKAVFTLGDLSRARDLLESLWADQKRTLGENDLETVKTQQNLGRCYDLLGKTEQAESLLRSSLKQYQEQLGKEHYRTLSTQQNLAASLRHQDPKKSLALTREILELNRAQLGEDHTETLRSRAFCADRQFDLENREAAIEEMEEVVAIATEKFGEGHQQTLSYLHRLGNAYLADEQLDRALSTLQKAFDLSEEQLGPNHPHTIAAMHMLGLRYTKCERFDEGLRLLEGSVERGESVLGAEHRNVVGGKFNLANQYRLANKPALAIKLLNGVISVGSTAFGEEDELVKAAKLDLAAAKTEQKTSESSENLARE